MPAGRVKARRNQMSALFHAGPTDGPGVGPVPNRPGPVDHAESSNPAADQLSAGCVVTKRQVAGTSRDVSTIDRIVGGGVNSFRFAARTRPTSGLITARSYVISPFTSISTSV